MQHSGLNSGYKVKPKAIIAIDSNYYNDTLTISSSLYKNTDQYRVLILISNRHGYLCLKVVLHRLRQ